MKIVTITTKVRTGTDPENPFIDIDAQCDVEVEDGFGAQIGLLAAIRGTKSTLRALEEKYEEMGFDGQDTVDREADAVRD